MDYIISGIGSIYCERPQAMDYLFGPIASSFK